MRNERRAFSCYRLALQGAQAQTHSFSGKFGNGEEMERGLSFLCLFEAYRRVRSLGFDLFDDGAGAMIDDTMMTHFSKTYL